MNILWMAEGFTIKHCTSIYVETSSSGLNSSEHCIFENVTTVWLKHPTLQMISIPLPRELHFHANNHFVGTDATFSNSEYLTVKWSFLKEEFAICSDYTWVSNSCSHRLITASLFKGWRHFLHLDTKIKVWKVWETCTWKMLCSWTFILVLQSV